MGKNLDIDKLILIDDTGMPQAPGIRQLLDKDVAILYQRDISKDKAKFIRECGVIYYLGDPKSPAHQQGLSEKEVVNKIIEFFVSFFANTVPIILVNLKIGIFTFPFLKYLSTSGSTGSLLKSLKPYL